MTAWYSASAVLDARLACGLDRCFTTMPLIIKPPLVDCLLRVFRLIDVCLVNVFPCHRDPRHVRHPGQASARVILNWPERIKTQPHDDRDNCFLHFDSKGPLRYDSEQ